MAKSPARRSGLDYIGTQTFKGLGIHVSVLWVVLLFVLVTVIVTNYVGLYKGLGKREFPDTTVNGDLTVDDHVSAKVNAHMSGKYGIVPGLTTTAIAAAATAVTVPDADTVYSSSWVSAAALTITLPKARAGRLVMYEQATGTAITATTNALTFTRSGSDTFNTVQPVVLPASNTGGQLTSDTATASDVSFLYTPAGATNNNWGGPGSVMSLYCAKEGVWNVNIPLAILEDSASTGADGAISFA
jgi:hypothetical protein